MIARTINKISKALRILRTKDSLLIKALMQGVAAGIEHRAPLRNHSFKTVIDIGANRGQFALIARHLYPDSELISFEPLPKPASVFSSIFSKDGKVTLENAAIGQEKTQSLMHISAQDDSSSLLPISLLQNKIFPGTGEVNTVNVNVAPLQAFINKKDIIAPALLKLDVQGYELEALLGSESLLSEFDMVYCECSFVELYTGQALAADVIAWLYERDFRVVGIYNPSYDRFGKAVQADFLYANDKKRG